MKVVLCVVLPSATRGELYPECRQARGLPYAPPTVQRPSDGSTRCCTTLPSSCHCRSQVAVAARFTVLSVCRPYASYAWYICWRERFMNYIFAAFLQRSAKSLERELPRFARYTPTIRRYWKSHSPESGERPPLPHSPRHGHYAPNMLVDAVHG